MVFSFTSVLAMLLKQVRWGSRMPRAIQCLRCGLNYQFTRLLWGKETSLQLSTINPTLISPTYSTPKCWWQFSTKLLKRNQRGPSARHVGFPDLHRCTEQEEGQVEEGEAGQHVLLLGHGAPVLLVLTVHHHHVDHEAHDRQAENKAEQKGALPPGKVPEMCQIMERRNTPCDIICYLCTDFHVYFCHFKRQFGHALTIALVSFRKTVT